MSIRQLNLVWEHSKQKGSALILLLAIADFADDNGRAFPSVETLAKKSRMGERNTRYALQAIVDSGELIIERNAGQRGVNVYRVMIERNLPLFSGAPYGRCTTCGATPDEPGQIDRHHVIPKSEGGSNDPSNLIDLCKPCHQALHKKRGAKIAGAKIAAATGGSEGVHQGSERGATAIAPEPSLTVIEPKSTPRASRKSSLPDSFGISEAVQKWAGENGFAPFLAAHLAYFLDYAKANRAMYLDWDAAFKNCIRADWGQVRKAMRAANPRLPVPVGAAAIDGSWWKSNEGITAKGRELGEVWPPIAEQTPGWFYHFKFRVFARAGDGPWMDGLSDSDKRAVDMLRPASEPAPA